MYTKKILLIFFSIIFILSCSKKAEKESVLLEKSLDLQVLEAYEEGLNFLKEGDPLFAAKKFNEAEILFPQSKWAPKSAIMAAYSYYTEDYYENAIAEIERFLRVYPNHKNLDYIYYLLAMCFYEQIVDEKKDLQSILESKKYFEYLIKTYPDTPYSSDAVFKIDLINDILASKEMYVGRYYFQKKKWIPALNRFKLVVDKYETTIYVEEALHRLVEINYTIGLINEAKKYATLLGYNYQSSQWYERSYKVFDELYELHENKNLKDKRSIVSKVKSLFD